MQVLFAQMARIQQGLTLPKNMAINYAIYGFAAAYTNHLGSDSHCLDVWRMRPAKEEFGLYFLVDCR